MRSRYEEESAPRCGCHYR